MRTTPSYFPLNRLPLGPFRLTQAALCCLTVVTLTGCGGGGGGLANPNAANPFLVGTNRTYVESIVLERRADQEFKNVSAFGFSGLSSPESSTHPFSFSNIDKAYGYGLSGQGVTLAVLDSGFNTLDDFKGNTAFPDLQRKYDAGKIRIAGSLQRGSDGHGNYVASIAAAPFDADLGASFYATATGGAYPETGPTAVFNHGVTGAAPEATLLLTDYNHFVGPQGWAQATDQARLNGAKVQNNSWALCAPNSSCLGPDPSDIRTALLNESFPGYPGASDRAAALQWLVAQTDTATTAQWNAYAQSLLQFQSSGVVVFALQNRSADTSPSIVAALPQLFPELQPAWLTVANMDSNFSLKSAPCGATAQYCLVTDGHEITGAGLDLQFYVRGSGTSSAAPQVSGMIALLSQAFPTLTPAQLSQRLLASANNRFGAFVSAGTRQFAPGVSHDYSNVYGHGVPDLYAALQPITSATVPQGFLIQNHATGQWVTIPVTQTTLKTGLAFGDAFSNGLRSSKALSFDALGAPFETTLNTFTKMRAPLSKGLQLSVKPTSAPYSALQSQGLTLFPNHPLRATRVSVTEGLQLHLQASPRDMLPYAEKGVQTPQLLVGFDPLDRSLPFVDQAQSVGLSLRLAEGVTANVFSSHPSQQPQGMQAHTPLGTSGVSFGGAFSLSNSAIRADWLMGMQREEGSFRDSRGYGAMQLGPQTDSLFFSPRLLIQTSEASELEFGASLGVSNTQTAAMGYSMIRSISSYVTSGAYGEFRHQGVFDTKDLAFVRLWQPERAESGTAQLRFPGYSSDRQQIVWRDEVLSLRPSGREINLSLGYQSLLRMDHTVGVLYNYKKNPGHNSTLSDVHAITLTWHRLF